MRDYVSIGPAPYVEDCAQVGTDGYRLRAKIECQMHILCIRQKLGLEPEGARLAIKSFPHDFGSYLEVVCYYNDDFSQAVAYAFACESHSPATWYEDTPVDWRAAGKPC